jgi:hypothetical protein
MATWTQSDIDTLKAAMATGILTVTYDGPPRRSVTYQSLDAMSKQLSQMQRSVAQAAGKAKPYRLATMRKGV